MMIECTSCFNKVNTDEIICFCLDCIKKEVKKMLAENKIIDMKTYISLDQYFRNY